MGILGAAIDPAVTADIGYSHGTTLQDFLSQFSSSGRPRIKTIDPFSAFDVSIKFFPRIEVLPEKKDLLDKLEDLGKEITRNVVNNVTGGLIGSMMNSTVNVLEKHDTAPKSKDVSFMEYLASASLLVGKDDGWIGEGVGQTVSPLELQLGVYCQEVTVPNFEVPQIGSSQNSIGEFPIGGTYVKTDSNVLVLKIINTQIPLHERIFYPWLRETTMNWWSYNTQPYTTATITVDYTKHSDISYVFGGCRPQKITMKQGTQDSSVELTRDVSFLFDYMIVKSNDIKANPKDTGIYKSVITREDKS